MSELITSPGARQDIRWQLLATASALALCGTTFTSGAANAQSTSRPTVWIEVGGQMEQLQNSQEAFAPPFTLAHLDAPFNFVSPLDIQRPPSHAFGGEGKISFEPAGTDWIFSAGLRYGRSNSSKDVHQQTATQKRVHFQSIFYTTSVPHFDDTVSAHHGSHAIADFTAGKDVGLGLFGHDSHSTISFGVRYAQFHDNATAVLRSGPDLFFPTNRKYEKPRHHQYYAHSVIEHSFSGIGPSLSVANSTPFVGNEEHGEIALDWGANAALLFGRQKVRGTHETSGMYFKPIGCCATGFLPDAQYATSTNVNRSRGVIIPNIGGFVGLTFQRADAKLKFGYRADFFFGAMDGGIDARRTSNVGFYGPFATISIGLGG